MAVEENMAPEPLYEFHDGGEGHRIYWLTNGQFPLEEYTQNVFNANPNNHVIIEDRIKWVMREIFFQIQAKHSSGFYSGRVTLRSIYVYNVIALRPTICIANFTDTGTKKKDIKACAEVLNAMLRLSTSMTTIKWHPESEIIDFRNKLRKTLLRIENAFEHPFMWGADRKFQLLYLIYEYTKNTNCLFSHEKISLCELKLKLLDWTNRVDPQIFHPSASYKNANYPNSLHGFLNFGRNLDAHIIEYYMESAIVTGGLREVNRLYYYRLIAPRLFIELNDLHDSYKQLFPSELQPWTDNENRYRDILVIGQRPTED